MGPRVALVVARQDGDLHDDGPPLLGALARLDITADVVPWGEGPDWAAYDGVLIRGTWDYILDRDAFLAWAEGVPRLANPAQVLRWNTDKRYLLELERSGIPVVPTMWIEPGQPVPDAAWDELVVKPSVSAGARLSARYRAGDDITDHVARIHASGSAAMVQPYVEGVDVTGETGTYVFGGEVSHAISKGAILDPGRPASDTLDAGSHQRVGPAPVLPTLAEFARRVLAASPPVLYARVDTVPGPDGEPLLMELEVTEPFLFLEHHPDAADNYAAAVAAWLDGGGP